MSTADGSAGYGSGAKDTVPRTKSTAGATMKPHFDRLWGSKHAKAGIQMDEVATFSVTDSRIADEMSQVLRRLPGIREASSIMDATACVGGNTVSFARSFRAVTAIELDPQRCDMLRNNLSVCKEDFLCSEVSIHNGDCTHLSEELPSHDIVFVDPPWGGVGCSQQQEVRLTLSGTPLHAFCRLLATRSRYIVIKVPPNTFLGDFDRDAALRQVSRTHMPKDDPKMLLVIYEYSPAPCIRGIWAKEDEPDEDWRRTVEKFGGMPAFDSKEECLEFVERHPSMKRGSNPASGCEQLRHIFTHLVSWDQVEEHLIAKAEEYDARFGLRPPDVALPAGNRYSGGGGAHAAASGEQACDAAQSVRDGLRRRLDNRLHFDPEHGRRLNRTSSLNTLKYLYNHMRCGIFVMVRDGRVVMFTPFANKDYRNDWDKHGGIQIETDGEDGSHKLEAYYREKVKHFRPENILGREKDDTSEWWANGNIICNEHTSPDQEFTQWWGDHLLVQLRHMLDEACKHRTMADCEFFINKRDYPQLKANGSEPYGFIFGRDDADPAEAGLPLLREKYDSYAPILSFYVSDTFADLPMPLSEDWEAATGKVFPRKASDLFCEENFKQFQKPWEEKDAVAFFRGNATGGGIDASTNQRIHLSQLSHDWDDPSHRNCGLLDAKLVGFNGRDKKVANKKMTFLRTNGPGSLPFDVGDKHRVPMYKQATYKYVIYVEGHCAANRYAFLMMMGSLIIKVDSICVADSMWYFPVLTALAADGSNWETADHVPVKKDLSDLAERLRWCREHDAECQRMVENCHAKYQKFVSRCAILDYFEMLAHEVATRSDHGVCCPSWWQPPKPALPPPQVRTSRLDHACAHVKTEHGDYEGELCWRCKEDLESEQQVARESEAAQANKADKRKSATGRERAKLKRARERGSQSSAPVAKKKFNSDALKRARK